MAESTLAIILASISTLATVVGFWLNNRASIKTADTLAKKDENEAKQAAIKARAEANRLEAETERMTAEETQKQVAYYVNSLNVLRNEMATYLITQKDMMIKIAALELKLSQSEVEKNALRDENSSLRVKVENQEKEILELQNKVKVLEDGIKPI